MSVVQERSQPEQRDKLQYFGPYICMQRGSPQTPRRDRGRVSQNVERVIRHNEARGNEIERRRASTGLSQICEVGAQSTSASNSYLTSYYEPREYETAAQAPHCARTQVSQREQVSQFSQHPRAVATPSNLSYGPRDHVPQISAYSLLRLGCTQ